MSRSGYSDCLDTWPLIRWRGQVASAIRGKRGQAFLRELLAALDAMPEKKLIAHDLKDASGQVCTLGAIGVARGVDMTALDPEEPEQLGIAFGIAHQLVAEIEYENDEGTYPLEAPEWRWQRMRAWVANQLRGVTTGEEPPK